MKNKATVNCVAVWKRLEGGISVEIQYEQCVASKLMSHNEFLNFVQEIGYLLRWPGVENVEVQLRLSKTVLERHNLIC
jgi:hypothetical protein